ncbi:hypothetical protein COP1_021519 [Malus domestica]
MQIDHFCFFDLSIGTCPYLHITRKETHLVLYFGYLSIWDSLNSFEPERFLESKIDVLGQNLKLIPFGGGRRIYPGLPLAMRMLNLMLGSLINSFD